MADKLRKTFPLKVTFADGEQPTSAKLTAISEQSRNGMAIIEKAVGDLWNQSGDSIYNSHPLQTPNLARMLGQNKDLNPALYPLPTAFKFKEALGQKYSGKSEGHLLFKPTAGSTPVVSGTAISSTPETNERDLNTTVSATAWWVDTATGRFRTLQALTGDETITYEVDPPNEWVVGQETVPGVIPDPRQTSAYSSCRVEDSSGTWLLHLPPRLPLDLLDATRERPVSYPASVDEALVYNNATTIVGDKKYWQDDTSDALEDPHYRYALPQEIQDASMSAGTELPQGSLYLYDTSTATIIEDVVFKIPLSGNTGYTLEISSASYTFVDSGDASTTGFDSGLVLITCGTPVARAVWSLYSAFYMHEHKKTGVLDSALSHTNLHDPNPPTDDLAAHNGRYPTYLPAWFPSNWEHDVHTSLLSRAGSHGTDNARTRDKYDNAMLGDLLMANADESGADNFLASGNPDGSYKVRFGEVNGPYIQGVTDNDVTVFENLVWRGEVAGPNGSGTFNYFFTFVG